MRPHALYKYGLKYPLATYLNPVEANIVENAGDDKWSSYRAYIGLAKT